MAAAGHVEQGGAQDRPQQVGLDHRLELLGRGRHQQPAEGGAGVVDQAPEVGGGLRDPRLGRGELRP